MSCEIIQFSAATRPAQKKIDTASAGTAIGDRILTPRQRRREGKPELPRNRDRQKFSHPDRAPRRLVASRPGGGLLAGAHRLAERA